MNNQLFEQYAQIKRNMKALEEEESLVKKAIMAELNEDGVEKAETVYGKFTIVPRKTYKYSVKIQSMEENLKIEKFNEVEKGVAKVIEKPYLLFTDNK